MYNILKIKIMIVIGLYLVGGISRRTSIDGRGNFRCEIRKYAKYERKKDTNEKESNVDAL